MTSPTLSVCMIVRNEAASLPRALASVAGVADEVIVVDTGSTDDTVEIARCSGARVFHLPWRQDFAAARNESLKHATGDWILVLDADEALAPGGGANLRGLMNLGPYAYELRIRNYLNDAGDADAMEHYLLRLFPNKPHYRYIGIIHEQLVSHDPADPLIRKGFQEVMILHDGYRAEVVEAKGKQARNRVLLEQACANEPDNPFHLFNLAQSQQNAGEKAEALASLTRCLELAAPNAAYGVPARIQLIDLTLQLESAEAAWQMVEAAPPDCHETPDYWIARGNVLLLLGRYMEAIGAFEEAASFAYHLDTFNRVDRGSFTWKPYHGIAQVWIGLGHPETAVMYLRQALAMCGENPMSRDQLGQIVEAVPWLG